MNSTYLSRISSQLDCLCSSFSVFIIVNKFPDLWKHLWSIKISIVARRPGPECVLCKNLYAMSSLIICISHITRETTIFPYRVNFFNLIYVFHFAPFGCQLKLYENKINSSELQSFNNLVLENTSTQLHLTSIQLLQHEA